MRFCFISDTHGLLPEIKGPVDFLFHCGDICPLGNHDWPHQLEYMQHTFLPWLDEQPAIYKVFIAGNHDYIWQTNPEEIGPTPLNCYYLKDNGTTLNGLNIYGSPWTPWFHDWAFNSPRYEPDKTEFMKERWALIPETTHVLLTHGPPHGILDEVGRPQHRIHQGCNELRKRVEALPNLQIHSFGHLHNNMQMYYHDSGKVFINAAQMDDTHFDRLVKNPIYFELDI